MALNKEELLGILDEGRDYLGKILLDVIEEALTSAVLYVSGRSIENKKFTEIGLGENKITHCKVIEAGDGTGHGVIIEFSKDFSEAWSSNMESKKIKLPEADKEIAERLFKKSDDAYKQAISEIHKIDVSSIVRKEFVSEIRYGTQEQLISEFMELFDKHLEGVKSRLDDNDCYACERLGLFNRPEITDIIQYLKDNGEDIFNVHVIDHKL